MTTSYKYIILHSMTFFPFHIKEPQLSERRGKNRSSTIISKGSYLGQKVGLHHMQTVRPRSFCTSFYLFRAATLGLTLILLNNLISHTHFWLSANQNTSSSVSLKFTNWMTKCRSLLDGFRSHLIWMYTVCKGGVVVNSRIRVKECILAINWQVAKTLIRLQKWVGWLGAVLFTCVKSHFCVM